MDEELSWAERMDHPIQWPFRLADLPEAHLAAEVLRRGNRMDESQFGVRSGYGHLS
jgi:hypothetical protein